eukprot:TRINITY_DN2258_c0_g1_i4.p1 TRINITY_DN2258_c0_g1~~TRINITY_DN2258_c0_g1_i4.p1  ORF type:complete len:701 (-),score=209.59 TRINITY_DN2258_c0_g1_i4:1181-3283(-)
MKQMCKSEHKRLVREEEEGEEEDAEDEDDEEKDDDMIDDSDMYLNDGVVIDSAATSGRGKRLFKIINKKSLLAAQLSALRQVADVLGLRLHHARTLLIFHRWDVEALFGKLADAGEERLFQKAGLPPRQAMEAPMSAETEVLCGICYSDVEAKEACMMDCGHSFCNTCWAQYLILKIQDGLSRRVTCMEPGCRAVCDEDKVRALVSAQNAAAAERYENSLLESYIEDNSRVKWCPSVPHCGNAISLQDGEEPWHEVECVCGQQFCFACLAAPHSPCSCAMWKAWQQKGRDESETGHWLTAHTKECPKCGKPVEKNGGCNLVACMCGQAFCWLCGAATGRDHTWTAIQGHACGSYKEEKERAAEQAQRDLERYLHYQMYFARHMDSLALEEKKRTEMQAAIAQLADREEDAGALKDYSWLTGGLQRFFRARRSLSSSYAFAFFMFGNDMFEEDIDMDPEKRVLLQHLFEDQQQQLQNTLERLSKLLEQNMGWQAQAQPQGQEQREAQSVTRMEVINLTTLVDSLCKRMYEVIENDLLGSVELTPHHIAPYLSTGYHRVQEEEEEALCSPKGEARASSSLNGGEAAESGRACEGAPQGEGAAASQRGQGNGNCNQGGTSAAFQAGARTDEWGAASRGHSQKFGADAEGGDAARQGEGEGEVEGSEALGGAGLPTAKRAFSPSCTPQPPTRRRPSRRRGETGS